MNMNKNDNAVKAGAKKFAGPTAEDIAATIGKNRSFAMTEAHKRLRTNVMFSFAFTMRIWVKAMSPAIR